MRKSDLIRLALLFFTILTLSGCLCVPYPADDGYRRGDNYDSDRGDHPRQRHDGQRYDDRDDRR
jgi:hypothetical protein